MTPDPSDLIGAGKAGSCVNGLCSKPAACKLNGVCLDGQAAQEAVQNSSSTNTARSPEEKALVGNAVGAPAGFLARVAAGRLCKDCSFQEKNLTRPASLKDCIHPILPLNLVTGERKFPCIIARGYEQLCGPLGAKWQRRY